MTWPAFPTDGVTATINGVEYVYDSANSVWNRVGTGTTNTTIDSITVANLVVSQTTHLGDPGNIFISGGNPGLYLTGNGTGGLKWVPPQAASLVANGTSNLNVPTDGNIAISVSGATNSVVFTSTGVNIAGYANITGAVNAPNITTGLITSNVAVGTAPFVITSNTRVANLNVARANISDNSLVTRQTTGVFYPVLISANTTSNYSLAVSPNIAIDTANSLLTIKNISITNNSNVDNLVASSNVTTSNLSVSTTANLLGASIQLGSNANVKLTGGTTGQYLQTDGTGNLTWASFSLPIINNGTSNVNVASSGNVVITSASNTVVTVTSTGANINGYANITGNIITSNNVVAGGNITANILISNVTTGTSPLVINSTTRVSNLNVARSNVSDYTSVTNTNSGIVYPAFANGSSTGNYALQSNSSIYANLSSGNLYAANFIGNVAGTVTGAATIAGSVTTSAQPNITSVGTLTGLTSGGVVNFITSSNVSLGAVGNVKITGGTAGQYLQTDGTGNLSFSSFAVTSLAYGTSNVSMPVQNGNINSYVNSNLSFVVTSTGANITGYANVNGNITGTGDATVTGNVNANILISNTTTGAPLVINSTTRVSNLNVARSNVSDYTLVTTTASSNMYFTFASASSTANYSLYSNTSIYANLTNSSIYAANFIGNGIQLSAIAGGNVVGTVSSATSATTAGTVTASAQPNITYLGTLSSLNVGGLATIQQTSEVITPLSGATGVVVHDTSLSSTFYHTVPAANFTINFINTNTTNNRTFTLVVLVAQGATPYIPNAVQINGSAQTILWLAGTVPTGTANRTDLFGFTLARVNNIWIVYAYQTYFG